MTAFNILPKMMTCYHKSKWIHQTADKNKRNGCQTCSLKIDLLAIVISDVKRKEKKNVIFSCVFPILKLSVVKVIILPWLAAFKKQHQCLS